MMRSSINESLKLAHEYSLFSIVSSKAQAMRLALEKNAVSVNLLPFALEMAKNFDERRSRGERLRFDGVTFTIKDNLWLQGAVSTFGSKYFIDFIPEESSECVQRLISLGAIPLAITRCSEFACIGVTTSPLFGDTYHPVDNGLTPGGSSGGAVTCCSLGLGDFALATDAGGSTRRPASLTGLVGLKPTTGLIPNEHGFKDPNFMISSVGIIANYVEDTRQVLAELASYSVTDILSVDIDRQVVPQLCMSPRAVYSQTLGCGFKIDYDVELLIKNALNKLSKSGWNVTVNECPFGESYNGYNLLGLQQAALAAFYGDKDLSLMHPSIVEQINIGKSLSGQDVINLLYDRTKIYSNIQIFLNEVDVLICPCVPTVAWSVSDLYPKKIRDEPAQVRDHAVFTPLFNYVGCPAISLPIGKNADGLPVGLQFVAKKKDDYILLSLAQQAENIFVEDF